MFGHKERPFEIRFAVGDPAGAHSSVWKVWASRSWPDVYILARAIGGSVKTSIHASGQRQTSFTKQYAQQHPERFATAGSRHFISWQGGVSTSHPLVTVEYRVLFPTSQLRVFPAEDAGHVIWLPHGPAGTATEVTFLLGPAAEIDGWPRASSATQLLAHGRLSDGRNAWLVYQQVPEGSFDNGPEAFEQLARDARLLVDRVMPSHRLLFWSETVGLGKMVAEFALDTFLKEKSRPAEG